MSLSHAALLVLAQPVGGAEMPPPEPAVHAQIFTGSVSNDDYPSSARRARQQGRTTIRFTVDRDGRGRDCRLLESSGSSVLDQTTCGLMTRRFRYRPARDAAGRAVAEWVVIQIAWSLPNRIAIGPLLPYSATEPAPGQDGVGSPGGEPAGGAAGSASNLARPVAAERVDQ